MRTLEFQATVVCELDQEYFLDWEELSPEARSFWSMAKTHGKQSHCEGQGGMGTWCKNCPFCKRFDTDY